MGVTVNSWAASGACRDSDPDVLFGQGASQNRAKALCLGCPVRTQCLADALDNRIEFGVWGGMTERERRALLRRRPNVRSWRQLLETARAERMRVTEVEAPVQDLMQEMAEASVYLRAAGDDATERATGYGPILWSRGTTAAVDLHVVEVRTAQRPENERPTDVEDDAAFRTESRNAFLAALLNLRTDRAERARLLGRAPQPWNSVEGAQR